MPDLALRWIPRFDFGDDSFQLTYPITRWNPGARTLGQMPRSITGAPGAVLRYRKYTLSFLLRFTEEEWPQIRSLMEWAQLGEAFTWFPGDADTILETPTSLSVYLDAPRVTDLVSPIRDGQMPWLLTLPITLTRADGLPWDFEYFREVPTEVAAHTVVVTLDDDSISVIGSTMAHAVVYDILGNVLDRPVTWSSSNNAVATIDQDGNITAVSDGSVVITASTPGVTGDVEGTADLTVTPFLGYYRTLTIDRTKCGTADTNDFPMLFSGTHTYLKTLANGGKVWNVNGYDIVFRDGAGNLLDFWIEEWNPATGLIVAWVRVPTITVAADAVIRLYYGASNISTDQQDADGTYDADFEGVWPLGTSAAIVLTDKSGDGNNLTNAGATAVAAQIRGGATVGAAKQLSAGLGGVAAAAKYTYELWWKANANPGGSPAQFVRIGTTSDSAGFSWSHNNATFLRAAYQQNASSVYVAAKLTTVVVGGTWYHLVVTWDGANLRAYLNGVLEATTAVASLKAPTGTAFLLGAAEAGIVDEIRLSKVARSASYIKASYNSQNSPATFYTIGAETGA